jgi:hypothetical protein
MSIRVEMGRDVRPVVMIGLSSTHINRHIYKNLDRASQNTKCAAIRDSMCECCAGK